MEPDVVNPTESDAEFLRGAAGAAENDGFPTHARKMNQIADWLDKLAERGVTRQWETPEEGRL